MLYTTISEILANKTFCLEKVEKLKTFIEFEANGFTETTPIALSTVLKSNGLNDTYWVLNLSEKGCYVLKTYAIWNAEKVLPIWEKQYPSDNRPRLAIEAAKKALKENKKAAPAGFSNAAAYAADYAADAAVDYAADFDARAAVAAAYAADYAAYADYADTDARVARAAVAVAAAAARADARAAARAARADAVAAFKKEQEAKLLRLLEEAS